MCEVPNDKSNAFWIVWDMEHTSTLHKYLSADAAYEAAKMSAEASPGVELYVMRALRKYQFPKQRVVSVDFVAGMDS